MYVPGTIRDSASTMIHHPLLAGKPVVSISVRRGVAEVLQRFKRESNSGWQGMAPREEKGKRSVGWKGAFG